MNKKNIFELVDKMPMAKLLNKFPNLKPQNLSLYSDFLSYLRSKQFGIIDNLDIFNKI